MLDLHAVELAHRSELVDAELAHGLEEPIAAGPVVELDQAPVDQPGDSIDHTARRHHQLVVRYRLGSLQRERSLEHRQPAKHHPIGLVEKVNAPHDRSPQRLLTRQRRARPASQQPERIVQAPHHTARPEPRRSRPWS
jgi:hypothetical protein